MLELAASTAVGQLLRSPPRSQARPRGGYPRPDYLRWLGRSPRGSLSPPVVSPPWTFSGQHHNRAVGHKTAGITPGSTSTAESRWTRSRPNSSCGERLPSLSSLSVIYSMDVTYSATSRRSSMTRSLRGMRGHCSRCSSMRHPAAEQLRQLDPTRDMRRSGCSAVSGPFSSASGRPDTDQNRERHCVSGPSPSWKGRMTPTLSVKKRT